MTWSEKKLNIDHGPHGDCKRVHVPKAKELAISTRDIMGY
jgi:hypothetical protein